MRHNRILTQKVLCVLLLKILPQTLHTALGAPMEHAVIQKHVE